MRAGARRRARRVAGRGNHPTERSHRRGSGAGGRRRDGAASTPRPLVPNPRPLSSEPRPPTPTPWPPLVGRSAEWTALTSAYASIGDDGHLVILEGEAGIGKTRLAEAFAADAQAGGAVAITARCYEGETSLALGPFIVGLRARLRAAFGRPDGPSRLEQVPLDWLSETARLLPELAGLRPDLPPAPPLVSPGAQTRFFEGISQVLLAVSEGTAPGVLFVDDLHWADAASLDLLTYLVRRLHGRPLCILATWRSELVPAGHRLRTLLSDAQRARMATVLSLPRLSESAVAELVQSVAPATPSSSARQAEQAVAGELTKRLYQETEGLPFFLVEYLTAMARDTQAVGRADWSLPGGVRDLLRARLAAVGQTASQLLSAAAVIGRSFDFDTLREASGRSEEETVAALEELIGQGLVHEVRGMESGQALTYDFGHEKLRALAYDETSLARRRLLHRRVAESLAGRTRGQRQIGVLAGQIAHHYQLAGQTAQAADYFKLAGEHARTLFANAEALAHFRAALALGHADTAALHQAIGDVQTLLGEYAGAVASYETAAALGDSDTLAAVKHKLSLVHHRRGAWDLAESHFQAATAALGETGRPGERAGLYADWSLTVHHRGQTGRARDLARQALALAEAAGETRALARAHNILGLLAGSQNDLAEACRHLERSLALVETLSDPSLRVAVLNNLALARRAGGDVEQALSLMRAALALCASLGDRHHEAALHNNLADLLHAAGQPEVAMAHLKQAVAIYAEIGVEAGAVQPEIWKLAEW
ncbi:MAG: AAA family ATPase [Chloroflexi bacterium]|nr:AAA family ATPase [Chloroflexota bacterium]